MLKKKKRRSWQKIVRGLRKSGPILAMSVLLIACGVSQKTLVIPEYDKKFFNCVLDEYERKEYGQCTERVVSDWSVIIDE